MLHVARVRSRGAVGGVVLLPTVCQVIYMKQIHVANLGKKKLMQYPPDMFRYQRHGQWILVRKEGKSYLTIDPIRLNLVELTILQACIIYDIQLGFEPEECIKRWSANGAHHAELSKAINDFISYAHSNHLL